jgi:hypothetical protein
MKLITEFKDSNLRYVVLREESTPGDSTTSSGKQVFIEGVFMQAEQQNMNGRIYPKEILASAVSKYIKEQVSTGRAVGELNHPEGPTINLDKVSHRITELKWLGNDVVGKALILNTPMGKIVKGLVEGGVKLGVSSRGMGTVEQRGGVTYVKDDFILSTVDIVQDPSAPSAFVKGIMENKSWIWENGLFKVQQLENYETEIRKASSNEKHLSRVQEACFRDFLSKL